MVAAPPTRILRPVALGRVVAVMVAGVPRASLANVLRPDELDAIRAEQETLSATGRFSFRLDRTIVLARRRLV